MKLKTFEKFGTFNFSDLGNNLSAEYHLNKDSGKNPYIKQGGIYTIIGPKRSIPKNAVYLTQEQVDNYNKLADKIKELQSQQEIIISK